MIEVLFIAKKIEPKMISSVLRNEKSLEFECYFNKHAST